MFANLIKLLKNEDGVTAIEYGLISAPPSAASPASCKLPRLRFSQQRPTAAAVGRCRFLYIEITRALFSPAVIRISDVIRSAASAALCLR
jgi:hypothetical protein